MSSLTRHQLSLLTSIALLTFLTCQVTSDLVTSSYKLTEMVHSEGHILDIIRKYIEERIDTLLNLSRQYYDEAKAHYTKTETKDRLSVAGHPNTYYLAMKRFYLTWGPAVDSHPRLQHLLKEKIPTKEDMSGAISALVRLQAVFNLETLDMISGNYVGYLGPPLPDDDLYEFGRVAYVDSYIKLSISWLELALSLQKQRGNTSLSDLSQTAALLGRAYNHIQDTERARQLYNYSHTLDPSVGDVKELKQELEEERLFVLDQTDRVRRNLSDLCTRGTFSRVSEIRPFHVCRLRKAFFNSYWTFKEEILSLEPFASLFYDVITDWEIDAIKDHAKYQLERAQTGFGKVGRETPKRTSDLAWAFDTKLEEASRVSQRIKVITGMEIDQRFYWNGSSSSEPFQVVNYGLGGHYSSHMDTMDRFSNSEPSKNGARIATFLIYLTDVQKGGNTVFPKAGISVAPIKGMALFWFSFSPDYNIPDALTTHCACPVLIGQKWVANKWIWTYGNTFRRPCGLSPSDTQMDLERLLREREEYRLSHDVTMPVSL